MGGRHHLGALVGGPIQPSAVEDVWVDWIGLEVIPRGGGGGEEEEEGRGRGEGGGGGGEGELWDQCRPCTM